MLTVFLLSTAPTWCWLSSPVPSTGGWRAEDLSCEPLQPGTVWLSQAALFGGCLCEESC